MEQRTLSILILLRNFFVHYKKNPSLNTKVIFDDTIDNMLIFHKYFDINPIELLKYPIPLFTSLLNKKIENENKENTKDKSDNKSMQELLRNLNTKKSS